MNINTNWVVSKLAKKRIKEDDLKFVVGIAIGSMNHTPLCHCMKYNITPSPRSRKQGGKLVVTGSPQKGYLALMDEELETGPETYPDFIIRGADGKITHKPNPPAINPQVEIIEDN